jgi:hypothetical protein
MPIFFNVHEAREYLLDNGYVYTLRTKRPPKAQVDHARWGSYYRFSDLGLVKIEFVMEVRDRHDLEPYVKESGFKTVNEWFTAAAPLARNLLKVTLLRIAP